MRVQVDFTGDPAKVLECAGSFLAERPVRHNLVLSLLHARVEAPEPGRYWTVAVDDRVVGVAFQSPLDFVAALTPLVPEAVAALVDAVVDQGVALPGVQGEADTTSRFAGAWTERTGTGALPDMGLRLYALEQVALPGVGGRLRAATAADADLLTGWMRAFQEETHGPPDSDAAGYVASRTAAGRLWVWDHDGPVSMAAFSAPLERVVRVQGVYTPPERRRRGYAAAAVAAVSQQAVDAGLRPILYTDLGNPTSNRIYRAIGYRAVAECLRYEFV
jgi:predicted GNAT family acetyltransferase